MGVGLFSSKFTLVVFLAIVNLLYCVATSKAIQLLGFQYGM